MIHRTIYISLYNVLCSISYKRNLRWNCFSYGFAIPHPLINLVLIIFLALVFDDRPQPKLQIALRSHYIFNLRKMQDRQLLEL